MKARIISVEPIVDLTLSHQEAQVLTTLISLTALNGEVGTMLSTIGNTLEAVGVPFKGVDWTDDQFEALAEAARPFSDLTLEAFDALEDGS